MRDLVLIVALYLQQKDTSSSHSHDCDDEIFSLLASDIDAFLSYIPALTPAISRILASDLAHLKALASGTVSPSPDSKERRESAIRSQYSRHGRRTESTGAAHNSIPSLSTHLSNRLDVLRDIQLTTLPAAQRQVSDTAASVLATHKKIVERTIHILERTKHGAFARADKAHAENLAKEAEELEAKTQWVHTRNFQSLIYHMLMTPRIMRREVLSATYSPATCVALTRYRDHLHDTRFRLEERQHNALRELAAYEAADDASGKGSGAVLEIAKSYGALADEVEAVREEIERLGGHA